MNQIQVTNRLNKPTQFPLGHTNETVKTTTGLGHISIVKRKCASTVSMECSVPVAPFNCQKGLHPRGTMAPAVNRLLCYAAKASAAHNSRVTGVAYAPKTSVHPKMPTASCQKPGHFSSVYMSGRWTQAHSRKHTTWEYFGPQEHKLGMLLGGSTTLQLLSN